MKVSDVAATLSVSEDKVRDLIKTGELAVTRIGRAVRVPEASVRRYVARNTFPSVPTTSPAA